MNKPSITAGTKKHKEALKLNRSMDNSSLPDGRAKSSAFQKKDDKRSDTEKKLQSKLDKRSSTYDYKPATKDEVKTYRDTAERGSKEVNRTVRASGDMTTRQTIHEDKQKSHEDETKWIEKSLKGAKKHRKKTARRKKRAEKAAKSKAEREQWLKDNPQC